ncbi:uncharacterized protein LOC109810756 [Cajanus cajan]|nr:uncharacterized protein LOC109810756 [Cajanus cajan]
MRSPQNHKEVQRLTGRLASLSRFIPKLAEKAKPIFNLLKKPKDFHWDDRCEQAFSDFKNFLSSPPILTKPQAQTDLLLYLAVMDNAISATLMQADGKKQIPVYFISRVLQVTEQRYQTIEKLVLALITSARRLRPYFQSHQIVVKTDYPIKQILRKPDLAGRMTAWSVELSEYEIKYESRGALKAQCLADFIAELTPSVSLEDPSWTLHVDGSSNTKGSGAGIILEGPNDMMLELAIKFDFRATNNQAEYEALLAGLRLAKDVGVKKLRCCSDSKLMTEQVGGRYQTKEPQLQRYNLMVSHLTSSFDHFQIEHIPRAQNLRVDLLSKLASTKRPGQHKTIIQETISTPSYDSAAILANTPGQSSWMTNIWQYFTDGTLPSNKVEATKIKAKACHFTIEAGELFKRGFLVPLLKCLDLDQAEYVMSEIHRGICGMHSGARSMAARVVRAGYYWPTMRSDCKTFVQKCEACQKFGNLHQLPATTLHSMQSAWPFAWWGMDILGPFPIAKGQLKFLIVGIDYFIKWIEAEPLVRITATNVQRFTWKKIICRYGLPQAITTNNGKQFVDKNFEQFLKQLRIKHKVTSVEHPQTNGQVEAANKVILRELKKRLGSSKGEWVEELPSVLWAYHCTPQTTSQETPYKLTYGSDAMIPVEVGEPSHRRLTFTESQNGEQLSLDRDLLDETREHARVQEEACKLRASRRYNSKLKPRSFHEGDLVWGATGNARKDTSAGKFAANWEGPFRILECLQNGAYRLTELSGKVLPRTWNATHLKFYFS